MFLIFLCFIFLTTYNSNNILTLSFKDSGPLINNCKLEKKIKSSGSSEDSLSVHCCGAEILLRTIKNELKETDLLRCDNENRNELSILLSWPLCHLYSYCPFFFSLFTTTLCTKDSLYKEVLKNTWTVASWC